MQSPEKQQQPTRNLAFKSEDIFGDILNNHDQNTNVPLVHQRYFYLVIYIVIALLSGTVFLNWQPVLNLYLQSGVYSWLCHKEEGLLVNDIAVSDVTPLIIGCDLQTQAINFLMPINVAAIFVFAFIGGLSIDYVGPKITALFGLIFQVLGYGVLGFCNEQFPLYPISNMLIGFGYQPIYFALLDIVYLFPNNKCLIIAMISAARTLSLTVPFSFSTLLTAYPDLLNLNSMSLGYSIGLMICLLIVAFVIPSKGFRDHCSVKQRTPNLENREMFEAPLAIRDRFNLFVMPSASLPTSVNSKEKDADMSFFEVHSNDSIYLSKQFRASRVLVDKGGTDSFRTSLNSGSSTSSLPSTFSGSGTFSPITKSLLGYQSLPLWKSVQSCQFILLFPIATISILSSSFFSNSSKEQLESHSNMFLFITFLSCLSTFIFGYLIDKYNPLVVMWIVNISGILQYGFLLIMNHLPNTFFAIVIMGSLVDSFFLIQIYCFISTHFSTNHFGKLSGIVIMSSGLLSLVVTPMCDFSSFSSNYVPMNGLCFGLNIFNSVLLFWLHKFDDQEISESTKAKLNKLTPKLNSELQNVEIHS